MNFCNLFERKMNLNDQEIERGIGGWKLSFSDDRLEFWSLRTMKNLEIFILK